MMFSILFGFMAAQAQTVPGVDEISIKAGRSVLLEVGRPTRLTCTPVVNPCEIKAKQSPNGQYDGLVALYVNNWQVTPAMSHQELLKEFKAFKEAGVCP
jgi:hypothetical protein